MLFLLIVADDVVQSVQSIAEDFRVRPDQLAGRRRRVLTKHMTELESNITQSSF